ncbi:hypothetical protein [Burkholderia ambifaria]|uniref:hypothetical protein n=1 Tax=Burkholderia ambifaria TaxID=152480 RepID=UPI0013DEF0BD|nr:hypothetical protein [Burkholderia ambifaria]
MRDSIGETQRSSGTERLPSGAWIRIERVTQARRCCCRSSARHASRGVLRSFIFIPQTLSCDSCCADDAVAYRSVDDSGGFQGLGGVFPDAPSIRCFPQVIQSGSVSPLLEPVIRHIVDCRADLDAKSRPAAKKTRRSKGSGDSPTSGASARCAKCFRFDIRVPVAVTCRRERRRAVQGIKKFSRDFPESARPLLRRRFHDVPDRPKTRNVSSEKHHFRRGGCF